VREVYLDEKGVFSRYDTYERKLNVGLGPDDFDPRNKSYNF